MITRTASARYEGTGKTGKGWISTQSGVLTEQRYGFGTRFENEPGTNPEELIAAAHAGCFTMALSFALGKAGFTAEKLTTEAAVDIQSKDGGFEITEITLNLKAKIPGITKEQFDEIAAGAKAGCPVSKALAAVKITLAAELQA